MATKSVIEIDVLDDRFQAFAKEFEKIQKAIKGMPKDWQNSFQTGIAGAKSTSSEIDKSTKKQKDYNKTLNDGYMILRNTSKTTAEIAKSMASTVLSATKWLGLGSLLSTGGVVALASQISQDRTKGLRLNVPTSQLRAAETTYGQLFPINSILEQISNARFDPMLNRTLKNFGGDFKTQNALEVFETVLPKLADYFKQFDPQTAKIRYQAMGLEGTGISLQDIFEAENMKPNELKSLIAQRQERTGQLQTSEETDKIMQDFYSNVKNAGRTIEIGLTKTIAPFIPYLNSFVNIISNFVAEHGEGFGQGALGGLKKIGEKEHEIVDAISGTIKDTKNKLEQREKEGKPFTYKRLDELFNITPMLQRQSKLWENTKEHFGFGGGGYTEEVIGEYKGKSTLDTMKYNSPAFNALLEQTKKDYKEQFGKDFPINSLLRDWDKQHQLFLDPKSYTPIDPRKYPKNYIFHKNALDTNVDPAWMEKEGWMRKNPKGDPVHYQMKDTNVSLNIFDNTGGNIIYNASAMRFA
jgi:hypothetical protein